MLKTMNIKKKAQNHQSKMHIILTEFHFYFVRIVNMEKVDKSQCCKMQGKISIILQFTSGQIVNWYIFLVSNFIIFIKSNITISYGILILPTGYTGLKQQGHKKTHTKIIPKCFCFCTANFGNDLKVALEMEQVNKMHYMYRMEYYGAIKIDQLIFTASMQLSFVNTVMLKKQQGKI